MKVGFCGSGAWGITLADLISRNGHEVTLWGIEADVLDALANGQRHPKFPDFAVSETIKYTSFIDDLIHCDVIVECVTAKGFRQVCEQIKAAGGLKQPFVITSKGIEQETGLLLVEVAYEVFGSRDHIGYLSGPTLAKEVMLKHPTSAVAAGPNQATIHLIKELFSAPFFKIYTNPDILGVAMGGAMKNVIAIASGMAEGLGYGYNTKAFIITRGLYEMKKLMQVKEADGKTSYGLAGIGDLIVTGISNLSRNFMFGNLLGQGHTPQSAKDEIGMVVEGEYTVRSAHQLAEEYGLNLPITKTMYRVIYEGLNPKDALTAILECTNKSELE